MTGFSVWPSARASSHGLRRSAGTAAGSLAFAGAVLAPDSFVAGALGSAAFGAGALATVVLASVDRPVAALPEADRLVAVVVVDATGLPAVLFGAGCFTTGSFTAACRAVAVFLGVAGVGADLAADALLAAILDVMR